MNSNRIKAFIRSVFPFAESAAVAAVAHFGWRVSPAVATYILGFGGVGLSAVLHWLEGHFPWMGVFLGWAGAPAYAPALKNILAANLDQAQSEIAQLQKELDAWKTAIPATGTATLTANGAASNA